MPVTPRVQTSLHGVHALLHRRVLHVGCTQQVREDEAVVVGGVRLGVVYLFWNGVFMFEDSGSRTHEI